MPQLPTFDVSSTQATELLEIFGGADGYKAWLKRELRTKVIKTRRASVTASSDAGVDADFDVLIPPVEPVEPDGE